MANVTTPATSLVVNCYCIASPLNKMKQKSCKYIQYALPLHLFVCTDSLLYTCTNVAIIRAMSRENLSSGFSNRQDSNRLAELQRLARGLKFRI